MKKASNIFISVIFLLFIFAVPVVSILERHEASSIYENRALQGKPEYSTERFLSGAYFQDWEKCFSDHIVGRNQLMRTYAWMNMDLLKKPVVNDVIVTQDVLLPFNEFARQGVYDFSEKADKMAKELGLLKETASEWGGKFYYVGIPEQYSYFRDYYPDYMENNNKWLEDTKNAFVSALHRYGVSFIDIENIYTELGRKKEFYSLGDHHYSYLGAFEACRAVMGKINEDTGKNLRVLEQEDMIFEVLPNPYLGSRSKKLFGLYQGGEKAMIGFLKDEIPFTRTDNGTEIDSSFYSIPMDTNAPITFTVYMGGDVAETVIQTNRPELPNLLFFGDSFTNPMESMIFAGFNETRIVDFRHFTEMTMTEYMKKYQPDVTICVRDDTNFLSFDGNGNIQ